MKDSAAMEEIRMIRDENSERRLRMTPEERDKESKAALDWLSKTLSKPPKVADN